MMLPKLEEAGIKTIMLFKVSEAIGGRHKSEALTVTSEKREEQRSSLPPVLLDRQDGTRPPHLKGTRVLQRFIPGGLEQTVRLST